MSQAVEVQVGGQTVVEIISAAPPQTVQIVSPGPQGPIGKSSYQHALDTGFVGTLNEWLASLKGDSITDFSLMTEADVTAALGFTPAANNHTHSYAIADISGLSAALAGKQATLVSGDTLKTINGQSLLGTGDLVIEGVGGDGSGTVTSVNSVAPDGTGNVTLTKNALGLGNVDNTADANKPVSTATQAALNGKAALAHTHAVADVTGLQAALDGKATAVHTHIISDVTGLQTALNAKADQSTTYTKTETDNRIQAVVGAAPAALDTLQEIATQLQADESAAAALTTAVAGKEAAITAGTTSQYWRGDKAWRDLNTDVRAAISAGGSLSYNPATGVFSYTAPTLATVATSGSYTDLSNKPTIPAAQVQTDWNAVSGMGVLLNKPTLATVASTGAYADLTGKPTIPATKADVGLGNVDNTSDANKPVSTAQQTALNAKLDKANGTATDNLSVVNANASGDATLTISAKTGNLAGDYFQTNGSNRWFFGKDNSAESGGNAGSNFVIRGYADDGSLLGDIVSIDRMYGIINFQTRPQFSGTFMATTTEVAAKQDALVSSTNIKTINGMSLLGPGDLSVGGASTYTLSGKTAAYTVVAGDNGKIINCTSGVFTVGLTAAATLGAGFHCEIWNTSVTATDVITIDPNAAETIDGVATIILRRGEGIEIICDGSNWQTGDKKTMRGYAENLTPTAARPSAAGISAVAIGHNASAAGDYSFAAGVLASAGSTRSTAIGDNSSSQGSVTATGAGAMALGGSYASGTDSFAAAVANNTSTYGATGTSSVAISVLNKASGANSAVLGGYGSTASGTISAVICGDGSTASATYSVAIGGKSKASLFGKQAYASGCFVNPGDAQSGTMVLRRQTTYSSPIEMTSDGAASGAANQIILPSDSTYAFRGLAVARNVANDADSKVWEFKGAIRRGATAGSVALIGTPAIDLIASDGSAWTLSISTDSVNGGMSVFITGEAGKTINAVATVWTTEVTG